MTNNPFMERLRSFFGIGIPQEPPKNDFRNPIWGDDDDDDGDELYTRDHIDIHPHDLHDHFSKQMHDMFQSFGSIFGDMRTFFHDFEGDRVDSFTNTEPRSEADHYDSNSIRDYYLKPGYHNHKQHHGKEDIDLDGKISSHDIAGLLKQREEQDPPALTPFNGSLVPGRPFCRTIITTSVTKPDGSRETKRIVKNGHEVIEETITTTEPGPKGLSAAMDTFSPSGMIYSNVLSELGSLFKNFY